MADIELLLSRLAKAKSTGTGKWLALCPAHDDRNPSLGIKLTDDGKILMKCWAGCGVESILAAIGLNLADLFPDPPMTAAYRKKDKANIAKFSRYELFPKLVYESNILVVAVSDLLAGRSLSSDDIKRVNQAVETILALRLEVE